MGRVRVLNKKQIHDAKNWARSVTIYVDYLASKPEARDMHFDELHEEAAEALEKLSALFGEMSQNRKKPD